MPALRSTRQQIQSRGLLMKLNKIADLREEVGIILSLEDPDKDHFSFTKKRQELTVLVLQKISKQPIHAPVWAKELLRLYE